MMSVDGLLLFAEILIFFVGVAYIYPRDKLFGIYFFFLFVYGIFAQIGYLYFPEVSESIQAYFGPDVWLPCALFITASFLTFIVVFILVRPLMFALMPFQLQLRETRFRTLWRFIGICWVLLSTAYLLGYILFNSDSLSWYAAQQEDLINTDPGLALFIFLTKYQVGTLIVLYRLAKQRIRLFPGIHCWLPFLCSATLFLVGTFKLGNRTDVLALFIGFAVMTVSEFKLSFRILIRAAVAIFALIALLLAVEATRYKDDALQEAPLSTRILSKDYYAPAHMLFAAAAYEYVDPDEVVASNLANAAVMLNYPYLQATVTNLFRPGVATRSAGYAFYVLTEGFLFMGYWGFIYNGLVLVIALTIWRQLASSNSREFNLLMLGLLGCMVVNVVRGQSSYFIKYLYTFVAPNVLLYLCVAGQDLRIRAKRFRPALSNA